MVNGRRSRLGALALLIALSALLAGCGPSGPADAAAPDALYAAATRGVALPDMAAIDSEELYDYVGIAPDLYTACCARAARDALVVDAVMLFTAADAERAKTIEAILGDYLAYRRAEMRDYLPRQYAVLEHAVLRRDGLRVALIISPEAERMDAAYGRALQP